MGGSYPRWFEALLRSGLSWGDIKGAEEYCHKKVAAEKKVKELNDLLDEVEAAMNSGVWSAFEIETILAKRKGGE